MRQRRQEAEHVAVGAAGEHDEALRVRGGRDRLGQGGVGLRGARLAPARPPPSRRGRARRRCAGRAAGGQPSRSSIVLPIDAGPVDQAVCLDRLDHGEGGGAGERVAAVRAAEAAGVRGVHDLGAAGHRGQRQAAGDALGGDDQVGHDALVVAREQVAGAGEAGLHLVGDEDDAVGAAPLGERRQEARRRDDEPALALDRLDDDGGQVRRRRPASRSRRSRAARRPAPSTPAVAERVGQRRAVDLGARTGRSRACRACSSRSAPSSGWCGRGTRGRTRRPPALRCGARAILTAFSTASAPELNSAVRFSWLPGVSRFSASATSHVAVVRRDHEAGVGERLHLRGDGVDDPRVAVADRGHRDARAEVDQRVAVDVDDDAAAGGRGVDRHGRADRARDGRGLAGLQLARARGRGSR